MVDESVHNDPRYLEEEIFSRLEEKFVDISHNMSLLMVDTTINIGMFG